MDSPLMGVLYGLRDGLNPCHLASMSILAAVIVLLSRKAALSRVFATGFLLAHVSIGSSIDLGFSNSFFLPSLESHEVLISFYMIVAAVFFVLGAWFCFCWIRLLMGRKIVLSFDLLGKFSEFCFPLGFFLGAVMAFFAAFWPPNVEITLVQVSALLPGRFFFGAMVVAVYEFFRVFLPAIFLLMYLWARENDRFSILIQGKRRFLCMLASVFYLGLSVSLVILFFPVRPV